MVSSGGLPYAYWAGGAARYPARRNKKGGGTCRRGSGTGRRFIIGIAAGPWTGSGRRSWTGYGPDVMRPKAKDWTVDADSGIARAHQHAAEARRARASDDHTGGFSE